MGFMPIDMILNRSPPVGQDTGRGRGSPDLTRLIERLPHDTMRDLIGLLKRMTPAEPSADTVATSGGAAKHPGCFLLLDIAHHGIS